MDVVTLYVLEIEPLTLYGLVFTAAGKRLPGTEQH